MFWSIGEGPRNVGRVELDAETLSLAPTTTSSSVERIRLRDVVGVLLQRGLLQVERRAEPSVRIGSLDTPGTLRELADRLAASAEVRDTERGLDERVEPVDRAT